MLEVSPCNHDRVAHAFSAAPSSSRSHRSAKPMLIGIDRATGLPTTIHTVITDTAGNLITMFPGVSF